MQKLNKNISENGNENENDNEDEKQTRNSYQYVCLIKSHGQMHRKQGKRTHNYIN